MITLFYRSLVLQRGQERKESAVALEPHFLLLVTQVVPLTQTCGRQGNIICTEKTKWSLRF